MKLKNCIAVVLVFATLFGLAACGKVKGNTEVRTYTEVYVEGDDGQKYKVQAETDSDTGETEYFYYDESEGKRVVIEAETDDQGVTRYYKTDDSGVAVTDASGNKVELTTTIETRTEIVAVENTSKGTNTTTTKKAASSGDSDEFIEDFSIEDYTDASTTAVDFVLGDDIHDLDDATTVQVSLNSDGTPAENSATFFETLASKDKFTVKAVNRTESNGTVTTVPITLIKSGDKIYFESSAPVDESGSTMTMFFIIDKANKTCNAYIPSAKITASIPYSNVNDVLSEFDDLDSGETDGTYLGTVKASLNGRTYDVAMYSQSDGSIAKYYYDNGTPVRVEVKSSDGSVSVTEYTISYTADASKFKTPTGYITVDSSSFQ